MKDYITCPECGNKTFEEATKSTGKQSGIKIFSDGEKDYDNAGPILPDEYGTPETLYLKCESCDQTYTIEEPNNQLIKV